MTFQTVAAKFVPVHVCVTACAIGMVYTGKTLKLPAVAELFHMAESAVQSLVFARKWEFCFRMIEEGGWPEGILVMARLAVIRKCFLMDVFVARVALCA